MERRRPVAFRRGAAAAAAPWRRTAPLQSPNSNAERPPHDSFQEPRRDSTFVGTCPDMCPAKERFQRERLRDLSLFERLDGNPGRTSPELAVKKFSRTISTSQWQASDIRSLTVLQETLIYLLSLLYNSDHPFEVLHDFVFDRTRSIRQDITIQNITNDESIHLYEEMVKFHIVSHQRLSRSSDKSGISSLVHLNMEQLIKCLMSLYDMYNINKRDGALKKNEAEFYSFYVLLHLSPNNPSAGNSLSLWYRKLTSAVFKSKQMYFARAALRYFQMGNYVQFFRLLSSDASNLQMCLVEPVVNEMRSRAVLYVNNSGYKLHPYPLKHLAKLLLLEESDLESLCSSCGLQVMTDEDTHVKFLPAKQMSFCLPKNFSMHYNFLGSEMLERWQIMCMDIRSLLIADTSE